MGLIQSLFDPSERSSQLQQHQFFDRQLLTELSEKSGFQVVNFATYLIKPFTHSQMEEVMKSGHFPNALISGLEKMAKYLPDMGCEMSVELRKNS
ncbi:MAG: hypothetical protein FJ267_14470 [Planctomycetes bacterium]|nr:hypothetical protein [Planctomycetota bacterium]